MWQKLADFSQFAEAKNFTLSSDLREGVCFGCSIEWLRLVVYDYKPASPDDRMDWLRTRFATIVGKQKEFLSKTKKQSGVSHQKRYRQAASGLGFDTDSIVATMESDDFDKVKLEGDSGKPFPVSAIRAFGKRALTPQTHHLILLQFRVDGSTDNIRHAVACSARLFNSSETVAYVFDPNQGEFVTNSATDLWNLLIDAGKVYGKNSHIHTARLIEMRKGIASFADFD